MIWMKNERVILGQSLAKSVDFGERENEMGVVGEDDDVAVCDWLEY